MWLRIQRFFFSLLLFAGLHFLSEVARADFLDFSKLPLPPRVSATGYGSDYAIGQTDLMLPVAGSSKQDLYINPSVGFGSDGQGYVDLGVGYRRIEKNWETILGAYVFGGYSRIENNARLWVANPGIEALGSRWDIHLNGYIPIGDRNVALYERNPSGLPFGQSAPCTNFPDGTSCDCSNGINGIAGPLFYAGHSLLTPALLPGLRFYQHVGDGADIKLGYQLFPRKPLKGYLGSYFFAPSQTNNIWGGAAGLEYWVDSHIKIFASYSYDTARHSTAAFGISAEFGGTRLDRADPSIEERMTDPVERYLAELGRGSKIPSKIGAQKIYTVIAQVLGINNIAFFSQNGGPNNGGVGLTLANCTFANPCGPTDLTNASVLTLNTLLPNTMMYFNGGSYSALDVPGGTNQVTLQVGQSVSSRTPDYTQPAIGTARSTFNGGFSLSSGNALNSIILVGPPNIADGFSILTDALVGAVNYSINCSKITGGGLADVNNGGSSGVITNSEIPDGVEPGDYAVPSLLTVINSSVGNVLTSNANVTLLNSRVGYVGAAGSYTYAIQSTGTNDIIIANNTIVDLTANGNGVTAFGLSTGDPSDSIQFNQGAIMVNGINGAMAVVASNSAGGSITISPSTICTVNGSTVPC